MMASVRQSWWRVGRLFGGSHSVCDVTRPPTHTPAKLIEIAAPVDVITSVGVANIIAMTQLRSNVSMPTLELLILLNMRADPSSGLVDGVLLCNNT